jgi:hypothetical protein
MQLENKSEPSAEPGKEFVFRLRNGTEVGRARTLSEFLAKLKTVPVESVDYHFSGHHFSPWLRYIRLNDLAGSIERLNSRGERLRQEIIDLVNSQTVSRFVGR